MHQHGSRVRRRYAGSAGWLLSIAAPRLELHVWSSSRSRLRLLQLFGQDLVELPLVPVSVQSRHSG